LLNALLSYTVYINKMVWPESLSVFYPLQLNIPLWLAAFSTAVFITISGLALWCVRSRPYLFTGWFWYVGMLVPVIGLVQVGGQALADRYSYLPLTGLFVLVVWTLSESKISLRYGTRLLWPAAGAVLLLFAFLTFRQNDLWRNDLSLFSHAAKINNNNSMAHSQLGSHFIKTGQIEEALKHLRVAIRIKPDDTKTQYNMGVALAHAKRFAEAEAHFVAAIKGDPRFGKAYYNLGFIQSARGDHQSAVDNFFHALQYLPASDEALSSLAFSLSEAGRTKEAISYYFNFLQRHPDQPDIYNNIGVAYARMGLMDDAEPYFKKAIALDPHNEDAWRNLKQLPARTSNKSAPK
jgi:Flp pilus assembly protein TadD